MFVLSERIAGLDWVEMRRQFEVDGVSLSELARRHGVASMTTVSRRAKSEQWVKPGQGAVTDLAPVVAVARIAPPPIQYQGPSQPEADRDAEVIPVSEAIAESVLHATAEAMNAEQPEQPSISVHHLAAVQSGRIREQLAISEEVTSTGRKLLASIRDMLDDDPDDPDKVARASAALRRLVGVNPDRETLAGLLKASSDIITRGLDIERRALGMDIRQRGGAAQPDPVEQLTRPGPARPAATLIKRLDMDLMKRLRESAQQAIQDRRRKEIEGHVAARSPSGAPSSAQ
jgi:hypothetical protein